MDKVLKIAKKVLQINEMGDTDVFLNISPHINGLTISIYNRGWSENKSPEVLSYYYSGDLHQPRDENKIIMTLDSILKREVIDG